MGSTRRHSESSEFALRCLYIHVQHVGWATLSMLLLLVLSALLMSVLILIISQLSMYLYKYLPGFVSESVAAYAMTDEDKVEEDRVKMYYDALNTWVRHQTCV